MIIFLYGEDSFSSRGKLNKLKEKFLDEVDKDGNSLITISGQTAERQEISSAIGTSSLFARKRMVVIEEIFSGKNPTVFTHLTEQLPKISAGENIIIFWDTAVILRKKKGKQLPFKLDARGQEKALPKYSRKLYDFLAKQKYAQNFSLLSNTEATNWIKTEVRKRGAVIKQPAALALTSLLGSDLWQISNEIDKLISHQRGQIKSLVGQNQEIEISNEAVAELVRGNFDENIFALTDAISNRNKAIAIKLFEEELAAGVTDSNLMHMIIRQFRILIQVKQSLELGLGPRKMMSQLRLHPFVVQKSLTQARNFSLPVLKNIFHHLVKIDKGSKTGQQDIKVALSMLIAKV